MHFIHTVYVETSSSLCLFRQLNQSTSAPTVCFVVYTVYVETLSSVCLFRELNQSTSAPTVCFVVYFYQKEKKMKS